MYDFERLKNLRKYEAQLEERLQFIDRELNQIRMDLNRTQRQINLHEQICNN